MSFNKLKFFLDNVTTKFDELGLKVVWRDDNDNKVELSISNLLYSYTSMKDKITLLSAIIDVWKVNQLIEVSSMSDLGSISKIDFDKMNRLFTVVKSEIKKLFTDIKDMDVYEVDMAKLDQFNERISKLKVV